MHAFTLTPVGLLCIFVGIICVSALQFHYENMPKGAATIPQMMQKKDGDGDANIMWLLDFKVDNLFNKGDSDASSIKRKRGRGKASNKMATARLEHLNNYVSSTSMQQPGSNNLMEDGLGSFDSQMLQLDPSNPEHVFTVDLSAIDDVANFEQVDLVDSFQVSSSPPRKNEFGMTEVSYDKDGKPRCTYTDLIERALSENGGLTVSEIYQWISDHYPFFRPDDDRWKNSVRHNLSINPYFKKGEKARSGAGHLWTISEESRALRPSLVCDEDGYFFLRKTDEIEDLSTMSIENDTDRAVANILGQYNLAKSKERKSNKPEKVHVGEDDLCTPPRKEQPQESLINFNATDGDNLMEIASIAFQYDPNGFPINDCEYKIDLSQLSQFQFPDASNFSFDDLMTGGNLIVIQTDDQQNQDANKENVSLDQSLTENTDFMENYSNSAIPVDSQSTDTERVSGQLISESLTQDLLTIFSTN